MSQINPYQSPTLLHPEPGQLPVSGPPTFGRILVSCLEVLANRWLTFLAAVVVVFLPWEMFLAYVEHNHTSEDDPFLFLFLALLSPLTVFLIAEGMVIAATRQQLLREEGGTAAAVLIALKSFPWLFVWVLVSGFAIGIGALFCVLPGIALNIFWMYVLPIGVNEREKYVNPLQASWQLTMSHLGVSVVTFLALCIPMLVLVVAPSFVVETYFPEYDSWLVSTVIGVFEDLIPLVVTCAFACAYHHLRQADAEKSELSAS